MVFAYYGNLSPKQKAIYRRSDAVEVVALGAPAVLAPRVEALRGALAAADRRQVERSAKALANAMLADLGLAPVGLKVLSARPSRNWGELQGLYESDEDGVLITLWMRTAKQKRIVAFRTFLRTLLHELCHHLDYELLGLEDSFHTEGFFKRESSLFHQLVPSPE